MRIFFFFNDTATTEIYTLSLHDALPILGGIGRDSGVGPGSREPQRRMGGVVVAVNQEVCGAGMRSEEHTSELQSRLHLVCRLLLEKKKKNQVSVVEDTANDSVCVDPVVI